MDDKNEPSEVVNIFDTKYRSILNDPLCESVENLSISSSNQACILPLLTLSNIDEAIGKISNALGWDLIHSNCLKWSGPIFRNLLCKFFNSLLQHNFVPERMLRGQIRPIVKDLTASKSDSGNYRPVMNSSNLFKVFEYSLLPTLTKHLKLSNKQFAFRADTDCVTAVLAMKEVIAKYNAEGSPVHCAMVDLTKAFDKVNYGKLMRKLRDSTLPKQIVDTMGYMFMNTYVNVQFAGVTSDPWKVGNGTRQGSVISPLLFSYYINEMTNCISDMHEGCTLAGVKFNIICYVDDIALLAPSRIGLESLLETLE